MFKALRRQRDEQGFTLIELLIVIIILGILAAIVVFAVGSTRKDSVASTCKTDFKSLELSAESVNTKVGLYPATATVNSKAVASGVTTVTPVAAGTNQLLSNNTAYQSGNNGALPKAWPSNSNYQFFYTQTGSPAGSSFSIDVYKPVTSGGTIVTPSNSADACENL